MKFCGYHSHSNFSDGKNTLEEMVLSAIEHGMPAIGFSDHSDTPCDQSYCMKTSQYAAYLAELNRLKETYADRITILRGLELDYDSDPAFTRQLDYFLGSVHYLIYGGDRVYAIDHARDIQLACIDREHGGNIHGMERDYFRDLQAHILKNKPTIIGHYDVITKFGLIDEENPEYRRLALEPLEEIVKVTPVMEINTGAIARKCREVPYPAMFILRRWRELGGQVILGADTHAVDTVDCAFTLAVERAKAAGYDHILTLWPDGFREEPI